jgi:Xaa-Pro aminopeptidase
MLVNADRARGLMGEFGLDGLVASSPENVTYLSGFSPQFTYLYRLATFYQDYVVFSADAGVPPVLIVSTHELPFALEFPTGVEDLRSFGPRRYARLEGVELTDWERRYDEVRGDASINSGSRGEALVKALVDKGLAKGRVGLEAGHIHEEVRERLGSELPGAVFEDAYELFRVIRMVKTPAEVERLRTVAEVNERAMAAVVEAIGPGVAEPELGRAFMAATAAEGAVFEFWNTTCGRKSAYSLMSQGRFFPDSEYRLQPGDLVRFDGGSTLDRYHSDTGNCAVIGEPSPQVLKTYRAIEAAVEAGIELARPGVKPSELHEAIAQAGEKMGLADYRYGRAGYGHGIGLEARDYPVIEPVKKSSSRFLPGSFDLPLEENMVMCFETGFQQIGLGGTQIEYTFLITANGPEKLIDHKRQLHIIEA